MTGDGIRGSQTCTGNIFHRARVALQTKELDYFLLLGRQAAHLLLIEGSQGIKGLNKKVAQFSDRIGYEKFVKDDEKAVIASCELVYGPHPASTLFGV